MQLANMQEVSPPRKSIKIILTWLEKEKNYNINMEMFREYTVALKNILKSLC